MSGPAIGRSGRYASLGLLLGLAAVIRVPWLPVGGIFDSDQGRTMLVLRGMLVDGNLPLLGPATSIGGIHHGATYFYLLSPVAWLSNIDPATIILVFLAAGLATVALTWWLADSIGGPVAGWTAGLLAALSPTAIAASATIWNPHLVPAVAMLAVAASWQAWRSRRAPWWVVAIGATGLAAQLHLLAALLALPLGWLLVADLRRADSRQRRARLAALGGGIVIAAIVTLPLIVHELVSGFGEARGMLAFIGSGSQPGGGDLASRFLVILARTAGWPIVGLVTDAPSASAALAGLVIIAAGWLLLRPSGPGRVGIRLTAGTLLFSLVALIFAAPGLDRVTPGLSNDHYHAFVDPLIAVLLGLTAGRLWTGGGAPTQSDPEVRVSGAAQGDWARRLAPRLPAALAIVLVAAIVTAELVHLLPAGDPDGGWPAVRAAADRVDRSVPTGAIRVAGLPAFKPTDHVRFGLLRAGRAVIDQRTFQQGGSTQDVTAALVIVCDRLFQVSVGAPCGGPAEAGAEEPGFPVLADRFDLSPRTSVSVYLRGAGD